MNILQVVETAFSSRDFLGYRYAACISKRSEFKNVSEERQKKRDSEESQLRELTTAAVAKSRFWEHHWPSMLQKQSWKAASKSLPYCR
jgi:hypothetical protein